MQQLLTFVAFVAFVALLLFIQIFINLFRTDLPPLKCIDPGQA